MKNCARRLAIALKAEGDVEVYQHAVDFLVKVGNVYIENDNDWADAYMDSQPCPEARKIDESYYKRIAQLNIQQKASLVGVAIKVEKGWGHDISGMDQSLFVDELSLETDESQDQSHQKALILLREYLTSQKLAFQSNRQLFLFLQSMMDRQTLEVSKNMVFFKTNFYSYRTSSLLKSYVIGQKELLSRSIVARYIQDDRGEGILAQLEHYESEFLQDPNEWFSDFLPQIDGWSLYLADKLSTNLSDSTTRNAWRNVFAVARTAKGRRPSAKFLIASQSVIEEVTGLFFCQLLDEIEDCLGHKGIAEIPSASGLMHDNRLIHRDYVPVLTGIMWMSRLVEIRRVAICLERVITRLFHKIGGVGPLNEMVGQAAIDSMISLGDPLNKERFKKLLEAHRKNKNLRKRLEKAIAQC
jgi:hypothetical protein